MGGSRWRAVAPLALTLILTTNAADAKWIVSPDIGLRELYSDNPTLATTDRQSDLITQITPAIRVDGSGARFKASLNYAPSAIFYAHHSGADRVANNLQALGTLEAAEKFVFVEVNGNISQGFISPLGAQPADEMRVGDRDRGLEDCESEARRREPGDRAEDGRRRAYLHIRMRARMASPCEPCQGMRRSARPAP